MQRVARRQKRRQRRKGDRSSSMLASQRHGVVMAGLLLTVIVIYYATTLLPLPLVSMINPAAAPSETQIVDWTKFAYVQYVTNTAYLCNSVMLFESLQRLGTKAERLMMYPSQFIPGSNSLEGRLLAKARDVYGVKLTPIIVQHRKSNDREFICPFVRHAQR